jgi:hypothetical protein
VRKPVKRKKKERKENREVSEKEGGYRICTDLKRFWISYPAIYETISPIGGGDLRLSPSR